MKQELFIGWVVLRRGVDDVCSSNKIKKKIVYQYMLTDLYS